MVRDTLEEDFDLTLYVEPDGMVQAAAPASRSGQVPAGRLKLARSYLSVGMKTKGEKILLDIVKKYPKSKQADEARAMLKKLRQPD
jgi:TolA-binding protein